LAGNRNYILHYDRDSNYFERIGYSNIDGLNDALEINNEIWFGGEDGIEIWNGSIRTAVQTNYDVYSLCNYDGLVFAGGEFTGLNGANHIAQYDGSGWSPLGGNTNGVVRALVEYDGALIAGGDFTLADGAARYIALWNGSNWLTVGTGTELNGRVRCLHVYNGELIVGGDFNSVDGTPTGYLARWDGTDWHSFGTGLNNYPTTLNTYNGDLIVSGEFTTAGGVPANHVARWHMSKGGFTY